MRNVKRVNFKIVHSREDLKELLRKYSTDDVIKRINRESSEIFRNSDKSEIKAIKKVSLPLYINRSTSPILHEANIMSWSLLDLAYYMICLSNDFRHNEIHCIEELYALVLSVDNYKELKEKDISEIEQNKNTPDFVYYFWGFAGEQFKFQQKENIFPNMSRELFMLFELNDSNEFDFKDIVNISFGLPWEDILFYLVIAWYGSTIFDSFDDISKHIVFRYPYSYENFIKVIQKYTTNYEEVKNSTIRRQILYTKPYIITQKGEVISVSPYLNIFLCEHSILWIIRNYYYPRQDFTNYFGILFEKYFAKVLSDCLNADEYEHITEENSKRADWKLSIGKYKLLIEQKSTLLSISAKQQEADVKAVKAYIIKTLGEALLQLTNTEKELNDGPYIKIVLLYEDYFSPEFLEQFRHFLPDGHIYDSSYWFLTINEMEMLLYACKENRFLFEKIIKEKMDRELDNSSGKNGIIRVMNDNGISKNDYIEKNEFKKYKEKIIDDVHMCFDWRE